jgi:dihydrodipicolinate reductase
MVLALAVARRETDYTKKKMRTLMTAGKLVRQFEKTYGTTQCRQISGLDLTTPEGRHKLETVVKAAKCRKVVETTARMLGELLRT